MVGNIPKLNILCNKLCNSGTHKCSIYVKVLASWIKKIRNYTGQQDN